jgi:hypothetical protein
MATIQLNYDDGGVTMTRVLPLVTERGLTHPDAVELFPPLSFVMNDGHIRTYFKGFRRIISLYLGVLFDRDDRLFVMRFLKASTKWVYHPDAGDVSVVLADPSGFEAQWLFDTELNPSYRLRLKDTNIYTRWPPSGVITEDNMYNKTFIEVTGTPDAPQPFTTNSGVLATDDSGLPYPAMLLTDYSPVLVLQSHQEAAIVQIGEIAQSGTDITFQLAAQRTGAAYADGKFYVTLGIALQDKTP